MGHAPDYYQDLSLRLSETLNDIGISERMVKKRRRTNLLQETLKTISKRLLGFPHSVYLLGSQTEGTTTIGLCSDVDTLHCDYDHTVIQSLREWTPGKINLLTIMDETTPPGYCYIQFLRGDVPLPYTEEYGQFVMDTNGRVLMKNTIIDEFADLVNRTREGPALTKEGHDKIIAYPFKSWPQSARHWLDQEHLMWPTAEMKRYAASSECFVVPTGSSVSENKDYQWRISTSLAERCLIFNLNITQIRCYVLLKMILKTYINTRGQTDITSFMCKTVLLHCIKSKPLHVWTEGNIVNCLTYCLSILKECILCSNCPHFIIPGNNIMAGKITAANKQRLLELMSTLIQNIAFCLLGIQTDRLGQRLLLSFNILNDVNVPFPFSTINLARSFTTSTLLMNNTALEINLTNKNYLMSLNNRSSEEQMRFLLTTVLDLAKYQTEGNSVIQTACRLLSPLVCTTAGTVLASYSMQHNVPIPLHALVWLSGGIQSDASSSRLKIASVFYCTGNMERADFFLRDTEENYNIHLVHPICKCYPQQNVPKNVGFQVMSTVYNEEALKYITAFCVRFLPSEINCAPKELQYEMFRSTRDEQLYRERVDAWMDWAVVDSSPYMYFLMYKTYGNLHRIQDQRHALDNLLLVTANEPNLSHRETAWNLAGQCMEQENRLDDALRCYIESIHVRQTNNVARVHICRLLVSRIAPARLQLPWRT